jgi:NitT/TauT family transport system substrate-binding protein
MVLRVLRVLRVLLSTGHALAARVGITSCAPGRLAAGLVIAASIASGCSAQRPALTVPVASWPGYEYFYLAAERGLAENLGLDLTIAEFADPQEIVHAYLRDDLSLAQLTTVEVVDICARVPNRCPVVILVLNESRGGDQLLARQEIGSITQLRGKRVGVTFSTLGPYVLSRALEREGLSLGDVEVRNVSLASMPAAIANGVLDAVVLFPPYSELAARQGRSKRLFDSSSIPGEIFDVLVVSPAYLAEQKDALVLLLRAWQAAHGLARQEPEATATLLARREGISVPEFRAAEKGLIYFSLAEQEALLAPDGQLARNLQSVRALQQQLNLVQTDSVTPQVSNLVIQAALR